MKEGYTLLIWEEVPEDISTYLIPNGEMTTELQNALTIANGCFANASGNTQEEDDALNLLNNACAPPKYKNSKMVNSPDIHKFKREIVKGALIQEHITLVCVSGFIM
jgi:hypothetical protein